MITKLTMTHRYHSPFAIIVVQSKKEGKNGAKSCCWYQRNHVIFLKADIESKYIYILQHCWHNCTCIEWTWFICLMHMKKCACAHGDTLFLDNCLLLLGPIQYCPPAFLCNVCKVSVRIHVAFLPFCFFFFKDYKAKKKFIIYMIFKSFSIYRIKEEKYKRMKWGWGFFGTTMV